jgi:hypothetical protein
MREPAGAKIQTTTRVLRGDALRQADEVIAQSQAVRAQLRRYETAVRRIRKHIEADGTLQRAKDFEAVRTDLSAQLPDLERRRHAWRLAMFRVQVDAGMSLAAISREWGFSRQLVSRMMNDIR